MEDDTMARLRDSRNASATKHEPPQCKQRDDHLNDDRQAPDEAPLPLELRVLADSPRAAAVVGFSLFFPLDWACSSNLIGVGFFSLMSCLAQPLRPQFPGQDGTGFDGR